MTHRHIRPRKKMKIAKLLLSLLTWSLAIGVTFLAAVLFLSKFETPVKFRIFYVESGSMEPAIPTGSMVVVRTGETFNEGEVITAKSTMGANTTVTHRIEEKIINEETGVVLYRLKGDANEEADRDLVNQNRVIGKVLLHVPFLGKVIAFSQSQIGFMVMIIMPATILAYNEVMTIKTEVLRLLEKKRRKEVVEKEVHTVTS